MSLDSFCQGAKTTANATPKRATASGKKPRVRAPRTKASAKGSAASHSEQPQTASESGGASGGSSTDQLVVKGDLGARTSGASKKRSSSAKTPRGKSSKKAKVDGKSEEKVSKERPAELDTEEAIKKTPEEAIKKTPEDEAKEKAQRQEDSHEAGSKGSAAEASKCSACEMEEEAAPLKEEPQEKASGSSGIAHNTSETEPAKRGKGVGGGPSSSSTESPAASSTAVPDHLLDALLEQAQSGAVDQAAAFMLVGVGHTCGLDSALLNSLPAVLIKAPSDRSDAETLMLAKVVIQLTAVRERAGD